MWSCDTWDRRCTGPPRVWCLPHGPIWQSVLVASSSSFSPATRSPMISISLPFCVRATDCGAPFPLPEPEYSIKTPAVCFPYRHRTCSDIRCGAARLGTAPSRASGSVGEGDLPARDIPVLSLVLDVAGLGGDVQVFQALARQQRPGALSVGGCSAGGLYPGAGEVGFTPKGKVDFYPVSNAGQLVAAAKSWPTVSARHLHSTEPRLVMTRQTPEGAPSAGPRPTPDPYGPLRGGQACQ